MRYRIEYKGRGKVSHNNMMVSYLLLCMYNQIKSTNPLTNMHACKKVEKPYQINHHVIHTHHPSSSSSSSPVMYRIHRPQKKKGRVYRIPHPLPLQRIIRTRRFLGVVDYHCASPMLVWLLFTVQPPVPMPLFVSWAVEGGRSAPVPGTPLPL